MVGRVKLAIGSIALSLLAIPSAADAQSFWQCAPFARFFSGIQLFGAAGGWWAQAAGKYAEGAMPRLGSVLVFKAVGAMRSGHVATVTQVVSDRIIKVTHANWGGSPGQVEHDVTVVDASPANDWSQVKVWYSPIGDVGTRPYPTYGFIYAGAKAMAHGAQVAAQDIRDDATRVIDRARP
jgi:surface antigen